MNPWIKWLAAASLVFAPLAFIGVFQGGDLISQMSGQPGSRSRGTEGDRRNALLAKLTTQYVAQGKDVTTPIRNGAEFAPIAYLNAELERAGTKWRVATVDGVNAETYTIS